MTAAARVYRDAVSGETMCFTRTAADTGGELLEMKTDYRPNSPKPPPHYHPRQSEHFEVISGSMTVEMNGTQRVYHTGETFDVPAGIAHAMWNAGEAQTQLLWQTRPALNSQAFFETIWELREAGKVGKNGTPSLLQSAVLMQAYGDVFCLVSPPRLIQIVLFGVLGFVGRLLGYRA